MFSLFRRLLDIERRFQRTECFIINYPEIDNLMEIAEFIALYLEVDSSPFSLFSVSGRFVLNIRGYTKG